MHSHILKSNDLQIGSDPLLKQKTGRLSGKEGESTEVSVSGASRGNPVKGHSSTRSAERKEDIACKSHIQLSERLCGPNKMYLLHLFAQGKESQDNQGSPSALSSSESTLWF